MNTPGMIFGLLLGQHPNMVKDDTFADVDKLCFLRLKLLVAKLFCMSLATLVTFKVKVPDGALKDLLDDVSWLPSNGRRLWNIAPSLARPSKGTGKSPGKSGHLNWLEELLKKILIRGSKATGEVLIPLSCVLSCLDNERASCPLHSHKFGQLTLALGAERPMLIGDTALVLPEGRAVKIDAGVAHAVPEQHSTCLPRVSINLFVATQAEVLSAPLSLCLLPLGARVQAGENGERGEATGEAAAASGVVLEPSTTLCAFRWARPSALDLSDRGAHPTDTVLQQLHNACCEALEMAETAEAPRKRLKRTQIPAELPGEWGVDSKVALDFAGLSEGARAVCFERLQKVFKDQESLQKVQNINSYCSSVIKGVGDSFGAELQPKLLGALKAKLEGSGWNLSDMDSSAVGALAGLPEASWMKRGNWRKLLVQALSTSLNLLYFKSWCFKCVSFLFSLLFHLCSMVSQHWDISQPLSQRFPKVSALEIVSSLRPSAVSNLSAFLTGAVKRQGAACPLRKALGSGWNAVAKCLASSKGELSSQTLVQAINMACQQQTAQSFEVACSALLRFPPGCKPPLSTYNHIFKAAGHVGRWPKAVELFSKLPEHLQPNRYSYTALFDAVVRGGGPQTMLWALWNNMQRNGVVADQQLMSTMLQGCSDVAVVDELLGELDWQGITPNLELLTSMVGCYRRAGAPTGKTWEVLKLARDKNLALDCQFLVQVVTALGFANDTGAVVLLIESARDIYKATFDD